MKGVTVQAEDCLRSGDLDRALSLLREEIKRQPAKPELRVFLFQLLSVLGQWDRALTQLNVAAEMDPDALLMAQTYRSALGCEAFRSEVFAGKRTALFFGEPAPWMVWMSQALPLLAEGRHEAAAALRDRAFEEAPATAGHIDGQAFAWVADADPRLGPMLEAVVNGKYFWIPFERIREMHVEKPVNLRDVVWASARFTWSNGGEAVGLIPSRYPGSETQEDSRLKMARRTDWMEADGGYHLGVGQRMFATDEGEYPLLETRGIVLEQPSSQPPQEGTADG